MKKISIVGNDYYYITDERNVLRKDGLSLDIPQTKKTVTLPLYGFNKTVDKEWLYWLSYFKLEMPNGYENRVFDIEFKDIFSLKHMKVDPKMVIFKKPVYLKDNNNYRLVARFPNYAISTAGVVHNMKTNAYNKPVSLSRVDSYKTSGVIDQAGLYKNPRQMTHRLVAITWVENDDYEKYYLVDHKDGDKSNCHYTNLRWMDHIGNNRAAVSQGLRTDAIKVVTRNINTNEIKEHASITDASLYIGRSRINTAHQPMSPHKIWTGDNGEFEMKSIDDKREWYYTDKIVKPPIKHTMYIDIYADNIKYEFNSIRQASIDLLKLDTPMTIKKFKERILQKYPGVKINIDNIVIYQAKKGERTVEANSISKLVELINNEVPKSTITKYLSKTTGINGWLFRLKPKYDDIKWPVYAEDNIYKPQRIKVLNTQTNKEMTFNSLRQIASHFGVDKKTIKNFIRNDLVFKDKFKFIVSL